jgi:hypothetical protein
MKQIRVVGKQSLSVEWKCFGKAFRQATNILTVQGEEPIFTMESQTEVAATLA